MKKLVLFFLALALVGCATRTTDSYIPVVDLKGRDGIAFLVDVKECRDLAKQRADAIQGAAAGAVVGALLGAVLAPRGYRNNLAAYGAGVGALSGGVAANETQEMIVKRCLAGRGYRVLA